MTDSSQTQATTSQSISIELASELGTLGQRFSQWHKTSRSELYQILSDCFALALEAKTDTNKGKALDDFLVEQEAKLESRSTVFHKVVRSVVGKYQYTRVSRYAQLFTKAESAKIKPEGLAEWIETNNGIGKIIKDEPKVNAGPTSGDKEKSKSSSMNESIDPQQQIQRGIRRVRNCDVLVNFNRFNGIPKGTEFILLLGKLIENDKIDLLKYIPDQCGLNDILIAAGKGEADDMNSDGNDVVSSDEDTSINVATLPLAAKQAQQAA